MKEEDVKKFSEEMRKLFVTVSENGGVINNFNIGLTKLLRKYGAIAKRKAIRK